MFYTIINDCRDANAMGRQATRLAALTGSTPTLIGVANDLEAAGNIVDILDAALSTSGVILVNVAPRNGVAKQWENGTPFGYVRIGKTIVVASIGGRTLSLLKKLGIITEIRLLDIATTTTAMVNAGMLDQNIREQIIHTQFRSLEFLPRVAWYLTTHGDLPSTPFPIADVPDVHALAWFVDNFGNVKTTLLPEELELTSGRVQTRFGTLPFYAHLSEVPDGTAALTRGSSGFGEKRFVEIIIQGGDAATSLGVTSGSPIM